MSDDRDHHDNEDEELERATGLPSFVWLFILGALVFLSLWWTAGSS
jgi:hypothetical protein